MRMAKVMKVGLTIPVGPTLRALFREANIAVDVRAWASPWALAKAERWGWNVGPTHLSFTSTTGTGLTLVFRTLTFGEEGPTLLSPDDTPLSKPMTIQGLALEVIRHFLAEKEGERIALHLGPSSSGLMDHYLGDAPFPEDLEVTITAHDGHDGYTRLKIMGDGAVSVKEAWGEASWWDGWVVSPEGAVEYVGTVDGPRYIPRWLSRALEEAKAKGM
jgi:hypothetical protein